MASPDKLVKQWDKLRRTIDSATNSTRQYQSQIRKSSQVIDRNRKMNDKQP